jgi:threonine synthase
MCPSDEAFNREEESSFNIFKELQAQHQTLNDKRRSLSERIEAFENITDLEVGDTPLIRARNAERETGVSQIFLKFEGGNPTGTQKDRIAFAQCMDALRRGYEGITLATCGNYGAACALAARIAGLQCVIFLPENYHSRRLQEIADLGAEIYRSPGDYEQAVAESQGFAVQMNFYDANPGGKNTSLQLKAYGEIAYEIYDELRDAPKVVAVPVSNGTVLAGIYKGFVSLYRRGKTSRVPVMVAGSANRKNPIVEAFLHHKTACEDLLPHRIHETEINEPLISWHAFDGDLSLAALWDTKGWARNVTDKRMLALARLLKDKEGLNVLPAATAGLAALLDAPSPEHVQNDRFVAILTARR